MMNLLQETIEILKENGKTKDDIIWFGCKDFQIPIEDFEKLTNVEYHSEHGSVEVALDLIVVGKDLWLERREYDGKEWWEYKQFPKTPSIIKKVSKIKGKGQSWCDEDEYTIANINSGIVG